MQNFLFMLLFSISVLIGFTLFVLVILSVSSGAVMLLSSASFTDALAFSAQYMLPLAIFIIAAGIFLDIVFNTR